MSARRGWSKSVGEYGYTVRVFERLNADGEVTSIYISCWDPDLANGKGGYIRRSLGHKDRDRALRYAIDQKEKLKAGLSKNGAGERAVTVGRLFRAYLLNHTPMKTEGQQQQDDRRIELWTTYLGADTDPHDLGRQMWDAFIQDRGSGAIDARGNPVPALSDRRTYIDPHSEEECYGVRTRSVEADLEWLNSVMRWGTTWPSAKDALLRFNPVKGLTAPSERNPVRPIATHDRFEAVRAVSDDIQMEIRWNGKREYRRSHLSEILDIVNGTGRRIGNIVGLHEDDLRPDEGRHGKVNWNPEDDKEGKAVFVPIGPQVRQALDRAMDREHADGCLFPCRDDPAEPISTDRARAWLRKAEAEAKVPHQRRGAWHPYRRKWATERKHLPDVDVAAYGGWDDLRSLQEAYQQPDDETMFKVATGARELRADG